MIDNAAFLNARDIFCHLKYKSETLVFPLFFSYTPLQPYYLSINTKNYL